jgi:hypothetical protein
LRIGKFDAHDPTSSHPGGPTFRAPHQDEPRIGESRRGGWVTRPHRSGSDNDTNASFRTESQWFLQGSEVIRGGEARAQMIALNRDNPAAVDERFLGLKPALEDAVKDHSAL